MNYGLMGTGLMGLPLAERLLAVSLPLTIYNRTPEKASVLVDVGATLAAQPTDLLQSVDCVILMLTDGAALRETLLTEDTLPLLRDRTFIQMGTIAPQESRDLAQTIENAGGSYLECPVLGSIPEAQSGQLILMVGSTPAQFETWKSLLENFGSNPRYIGEVGTAMALKLALNQLIAGLTSTFALSLGFVQQQGVEVDQFMDIVRKSALYAPTFDKKLQRMLNRNFANPNFPVKHLAKDVNLFLQESNATPLNDSGLEAIAAILQETIATGLADGDYSALFQTLCP
ncbi:MAG: NAD(P)-dependent oxidoreductase [Prochlorotrichaceae cyanobacterium]